MLKSWRGEGVKKQRFDGHQSGIITHDMRSLKGEPNCPKHLRRKGKPRKSPTIKERNSGDIVTGGRQRVSNT